MVGDAEVVLATTGGDVVCFELSAVLDGVVVEAVAPRTRWLFSSRVPIFGSPCWLDGDTGDSSSGGRRVCITGATGLVLALRCADGTVSWRLELGTPVFSSPCALPGGLVVIGAHDKFARALWAQDGTLAWRHGMSDVVYSSAVVCACGGAAAVLVCSADGSIEMLSATGAQLHRLGRLPGQVRARARVRSRAVAGHVCAVCAAEPSRLRCSRRPPWFPGAHCSGAETTSCTQSGCRGRSSWCGSMLVCACIVCVVRE